MAQLRSSGRSAFGPLAEVKRTNQKRAAALPPIKPWQPLPRFAAHFFWNDTYYRRGQPAIR